MPGILEYMAREHAKCDEQFANAEEQVSKSNWAEATATFGEFEASLERHFMMEENVLFAYLEATMGTQGGPLAVMKMEHAQMRELFPRMTEMVQQERKDDFLGTSETLLVLMQQHNMKEEQIVYPMAERMLASGQDQVIEEMENV